MLAWASKIDAGGRFLGDVFVDALTGLAYPACGLVLFARRLHARFACLLVLAAAAWFAEDLVTSSVAPLYATGVLSSAFDALLLAMLLSYPDGRLRSGRERLAVAVAGVAAIGVPAFCVPRRSATAALLHQRVSRGAALFFSAATWNAVSTRAGTLPPPRRSRCW